MPSNIAWATALLVISQDAVGPLMCLARARESASTVPAQNSKTVSHPLLARGQAAVDAVLSDECHKSVGASTSCGVEADDRMRATLNDALFELAVKGFGAAEGITPAFPGVLLNDVVHRFIYHNESTAHRVDSLDMPKALRGWPELGLALGLLHDMDHYARNCLGFAPATSATTGPNSHHSSISSFSSSSSSSISSRSSSSHQHRVCVTAAHHHLDARWALADNWPSLAHAASRVCSTSHHRAQGRGRDGKEFHARKLNELPLRRADLARRVLGLAASNGHGDAFFELGVRGSVQVISVERGPSVGATSAFCRRQGRLPVSPPSPTSSSSSGSSSSSSRSRSIVSAVEDATPTVVFAFGDSSMCKPLLSSAKAAGVNVELLKYEKNLGHRQMVEKLLVKFKALPPHTLVVKLDGTDVLLAQDSGSRAFRDRWEQLGKGVLFSAEAALFYHIGANLHDCTRTSQLPPTPTVYRFLNSGGYLGEAGDLAKVLRAALDLTRKVWQSPDDQSVYASWYAHAALNTSAHAVAPPIKLDHCHDVFATLSGASGTAHASTLIIKHHTGGGGGGGGGGDGGGSGNGGGGGATYSHRLTGSHPIVVHLPGRAKRFSDFVAALPGGNGRKGKQRVRALRSNGP